MQARTRSSSLEYQILVTAVLCLLAAGAVMVYSASSARTLLEGEGDSSAFLVRYVGYGALGLLAMWVMSRRGVDLMLRLTTPLLGVAFVLLVLVKIPGIGVEVNGARRWLGAGPLQFQPSEVMKLALLLYAVRMLADKPKLVLEPRLLAPLGMVAGAAALLIASQPDLGTALVIGFTMTALLVAAGISLRHLLIGGAVMAVLVLLFALLEPYRRRALTSFLNPWEDAGGAGFQSVQGQIALGLGRPVRQGPGRLDAEGALPARGPHGLHPGHHREELGVFGVGVLLFLYGLIAYAGLRIAKAARDRYTQLLAAGSPRWCSARRRSTSSPSSGSRR
jgi:cell division protein FtsW